MLCVTVNLFVYYSSIVLSIFFSFFFLFSQLTIRRAIHLSRCCCVFSVCVTRVALFLLISGLYNRLLMPRLGYIISPFGVEQHHSWMMWEKTRQNLYPIRIFSILYIKKYKFSCSPVVAVVAVSKTLVLRCELIRNHGRAGMVLLYTSRLSALLSFQFVSLWSDWWQTAHLFYNISFSLFFSFLFTDNINYSTTTRELYTPSSFST